VRRRIGAVMVSRSCPFFLSVWLGDPFRSLALFILAGMVRPRKNSLVELAHHFGLTDHLFHKTCLLASRDSGDWILSFGRTKEISYKRFFVFTPLLGGFFVSKPRDIWRIFQRRFAIR
jgi:hypothetical protein